MKTQRYLLVLLLAAACTRSGSDKGSSAEACETSGPTTPQPPLGPSVTARGSWGGDCYESTGPLSSEERTVPAFRRLKVAGSMDVVLRQGDTRSVRVKAAADLLEQIETEVRGDTLVIGMKHGCYRSKRPTRAYVTAPDLTAVTLAGSGDLSAKTSLRAKELSIRIAGSGNAKLDVDVDDLETRIDGSGDATLSGSASAQRIRLNGSGNVEARKLTTKQSRVSVNGSGNVYVHASESLEAVVNGSGDIRYAGSPQVSSVVRGSGDINALR